MFVATLSSPLFGELQVEKIPNKKGFFKISQNIQASPLQKLIEACKALYYAIMHLVFRSKNADEERNRAWSKVKKGFTYQGEIDPEFIKELKCSGDLYNKQEIANALKNHHPFVQAMISDVAWAIKYFSDQSKTPDIAMIAVSSDGYTLFDLPSVLQTHAVIKKAMETTQKILEDERMKKFLSDKPFVLSILEKNGALYPFLPPQMQEEEDIIRATVDKQIFIIKTIPQDIQIKKQNLILELVKKNPLYFKYLCDALTMNEEIAIAAIKQNDTLLKNIHSSLLKKKQFILRIFNEVPKVFDNEKNCKLIYDIHHDDDDFVQAAMKVEKFSAFIIDYMSKKLLEPVGGS